MSDEQTATARETGQSAFAVEIEVSGHRLTGDEPAAAGGGNLGPSPFDLLTAALAECTAMTVRWYARQQGWPLDHVEVSVHHMKGGDGTSSARQDRFDKRVRLDGAGLDDDQRRRLLEVAAKCPVQRSLEGTPLILTRAG